MSNLKYIGCLLYCLLATTGLTQVNNFKFEHIDQPPNAPIHTIFKIYEADKGFLWYGTVNGLYRYDGYSFKVFHHNVLDSTALSHPTIYEIFKDPKNAFFWLGTGKGLNKFDLNSGKVKRYYPHPELIEKGLKERNRVYSVLSINEEKLLISTSMGLSIFDPKTEQFEEINIEDKKKDVYFFHKTQKDLQGQIWCSTQDAILSIDVAAKKARRVEIPALHEWGKTGSFRSTIIDKQGNFWFSLGQDVLKWHPNEGRATKITLPKHEQNRIYRLFMDRDEKLWVSFSRGNLVIYDTKQQQSSLFVNDASQPVNIFEGGFLDLTRDYSDNTWIGTSSGIWKVSTRDFEHILNVPASNKRPNEVRQLVEDSRGYIYASTIDGIFRHSPDRREIIKIPFDINGEQLFLGALHLYIDADNSLWASIAHSKSVSVYRCQAGEDVLTNLELSGNLSKGGVYRIMQDEVKEDFLWLATAMGLCHLNKKTLEWQGFKPKDDLPELPFNRLTYLVQADSTALWTYYLGASAIGRFDLSKQTFDIYRPPPERSHTLGGELRTFHIDKDKKIWIATSDGLTEFDTKVKSFAFYTTKDGLPENNLQCAIPDSNGKLWLFGSASISLFSLDGHIDKQFHIGQDLKRLSKVHFQNPDSTFLIGGLNGFYRINPQESEQNSHPPKIALTDFKVADKSYDLGLAPENVDKIQLSSKQNSITFEFAALHYLEPENNLYKCQLIGFDHDWRVLGKERKVTYTNLPPALYTFRVLASNSDGIWNEEGLTIDLLITPTMWQTNWFKALIALALLVIGYAMIRNQQQRTILKQEKELAEQSAKYKSQFLTNISHEIRTPMNAIIGLSNLMSDTKLSEKQTEYTSAINQSSKNLLSIINDLLDHAKIESGKFTFVKRPFDLETSINQLYNTLIFKAKEKKLALTTKIEEGIPVQLIGDAVRLQQILLNLTGNALKFTEKGEVSVKVEKINQQADKIWLGFEVMDTGVGIPNEKLKIIFENFKQADDEVFAQYGGTGLGLSISKELVEQQGGQLKINSEVGKGTTLTFQLPFDIAPASAPKKAVSPLHFEFKNLNILLVEDTYFNQMLAMELLKRKIEGVQIDIADNGKIALEKLQEHDYDLILMDVKMPVMNGFEATKIIRQIPSKKSNIPIIALTANAVPEQLEKCKMVGMNEIVTKPINGEELFEKIGLVLKKD